MFYSISLCLLYDRELQQALRSKRVFRNGKPIV